MSKLTYANFIPLIGGISLAIKEDLGGQKPLFNISYDAFAKNDSYFFEYEKGVPTYIFKKDDPLVKMKKEVEKHGVPDVLCGLPPCGSISMLSTRNTDTKVRTSDDTSACWMRYFANFSFHHLKPKAILMENAPSLYNGAMAQDLRDYFESAAKKAGYSIQYVKTDTRFAGIPQQRKRTYLIAFRDGYGGIEPPDKIPTKTLESVVGNDKKGKPLHNLSDSPFYHYMLKEIGKDYRKKIAADVKAHGTKAGMMTIFTYIQKFQNKTFDVLLKYGDDRFQKNINRILDKLADNKGYWDYAPLVPLGQVNAMIAKNAIRTIHPTEERFFTNREIMRLMGMPEDMEPPPANQFNVICQNAPVSTSRRMFGVIKKYLNAKDDEKTKGDVLKYDDFKEKWEVA